MTEETTPLCEQDQPNHANLSPWFWLCACVSLLLGLLLLWGVGYYAIRLLIYLTTPGLLLEAGACLARVCALILIPRRLVRVVDVNGKTVDTAYPHHRLKVDPIPLLLAGQERYAILSQVWKRGYRLHGKVVVMPTFIPAQFTDSNGQVVVCADVEEE